MDSPIREPSTLEDKSDPVLSPLFLSPGEDTSTSSSPNSSSQHSGSPCDDWAFPGSGWNPLCDPKSQALDDLNLNLGFEFPSSLSQDQWPSMDMDTDISAFMPDSTPHFSIDPPGTPHLGPVYNESSHEQLLPSNRDSIFHFLLSQPPDTALGPTVPVQLLPPKASALISRTVSPSPSKSGDDSSAGVNPNDLSLLTQISQKARTTVGVTLAVRAKYDSQGTVAEDQTLMTPLTPTSSQPKVPIPRLRLAAAAPQNAQPSTTATAKQMPPNSQQPSMSSSALPEVSELVPTSKSGRPKTSHTTIERRYRTNLNARILALRRAVPALRILEKNTPVQTQGKGLTGASAAKWDFDDVVNERGYVDGVKAAKKNSKGVVLGKAVEYIKVLKRRETRLRREADGLRELLSGLVGGPELLHAWEKEWRDRFGGEEADEVSGDPEENEEGDADGEDGEDGEDGDTDDEDGRAKKRVRVEKKEQKAPPAPQVEKRRRGRPRKIPQPDLPAALPHLTLQPQDVQAQHQPSKYLLATFLLFNFFSPNVPRAASSQTQGGSVLTPLPNSDTVLGQAPPWTALQAVNMLVSVLLLLSLVGPYLPSKVTRLLPHALHFAFPGPSPPVMQKSDRHFLYPSPMRNMAISAAYASGDERALRNALGADGILYPVFKGAGWALLGSVKRALHIPGRAGRMLTSQEEIELRGWRNISQLEALRGVNTSLFRKIQAFVSFSSCLPSSAVSPSDHITLALLAHSFTTSTATEHWEAARRSDTKTSSEALVLELDIGEAAEIISTAQSPSLSPSDAGRLSLVHHIAAHVVLVRTKALAARQFISSVSGQRTVDLDHTVNSEAASTFSRDAEVKMVVAAGRELGGALGDLTLLLNKVDHCPTAEVLATLPQFELNTMNDGVELSDSERGGSPSDGQPEDAVNDTRLLLLATLLYRRIFPAQDVTTTHVLSPPPSPTPKCSRLHLALRRALASTAFDASPETEDARDRVVDMLAETRRGRFGGVGGVRNNTL